MTSVLPHRLAEILLVEDDPGDIRFIQETLRDGKIRNRLHVVTDGLAAQAFLYRQDPYTDAPRPDLVLLDLNLPGKDGRDVLADLKSTPQLNDIPVVVLTASLSEQDEWRAHALQVHAYLTKPVDVERFIAVVHSVRGLGFLAVTVNSGEGAPR